MLERRCLLLRSCVLLRSLLLRSCLLERSAMLVRSAMLLRSLMLERSAMLLRSLLLRSLLLRSCLLERSAMLVRSCLLERSLMLERSGPFRPAAFPALPSRAPPHLAAMLLTVMGIPISRNGRPLGPQAMRSWGTPSLPISPRRFFLKKTLTSQPSRSNPLPNRALLPRCFFRAPTAARTARVAIRPPPLHAPSPADHFASFRG